MLAGPVFDKGDGEAGGLPVTSTSAAPTMNVQAIDD
jgi:hypothetical protein